MDFAPFTFADLTRLPSARVTLGCWSHFHAVRFYLSVSLMTLFLPSGTTTCVSLIKALCTPTTHPVLSSPALQHTLKYLGCHQAQATHFNFCLHDIHSSQSFLVSPSSPSASFPWPLLPLLEDPLGVLGSNTLSSTQISTDCPSLCLGHLPLQTETEKKLPLHSYCMVPGSHRAGRDMD